MELKHTPGPWGWADDGKGNRWGRYRLDPYVITGTVEGLISVDDEDARLIAAAPDLLEALIDAVEYLKNHLPDNMLAPHLAAIVNATGEYK